MNLFQRSLNISNGFYVVLIEKNEAIKKFNE